MLGNNFLLGKLLSCDKDIYLVSIEKILISTCSGDDTEVVFGCEMFFFNHNTLEDKSKLIWQSFQHFFLENCFQRKLQ